MLSLERLSLYECVPVGADAMDAGDDDSDFEEAVGADDDGDDEPEQAASDDSQPGGDVAAAAAVVPQQQPPPAPAAAPPPPPPPRLHPADDGKQRTDNLPDSKLCKLCKWRYPGFRGKWEPIVQDGANAPAYLDGDARTWFMRCCTKHRSWLAENTVLCTQYKNSRETPFAEAKGFEDASVIGLYRCRKYTTPDRPECTVCERRLAKEAKEAEARRKQAEKSQKKVNRQTKKDASRSARLAREQKKSAAAEKKRLDDEAAAARRAAQKAMREAMGEYGQPFGPPPKPTDKERNDDPTKAAELDAALRQWEATLQQRFGSLDDQGGYTSEDPSVPKVDNAERPVPASEDERSQETKDATKWYTSNRVTNVENLDDQGCCATKQ